jgi:hypothetical protein
MVTLHATFRLRDDALAKFWMLFKDDSVERSLCVLGHAQMSALTCADYVMIFEEEVNSLTEKIRDRPTLLGGYLLEAIELPGIIAVCPLNQSHFQTNLLAGRMVGLRKVGLNYPWWLLMARWIVGNARQ